MSHMLSMGNLLSACLMLSVTSALFPLPYRDEFQKVVSTAMGEKAQQCDNFELMRCANVYFKSLGFFRPPQSFDEFDKKVDRLLASADPNSLKSFCSATNAFGTCYGDGLVDDCLNAGNLQNLGIRHKDAKMYSLSADLYAYMCGDAAYPILHGHWACLVKPPAASQAMIRQCVNTLINETQAHVPHCQVTQHWSNCLQRALASGCGEDLGLVWCRVDIVIAKLWSVALGLKQCPCIYCDEAAAAQVNPMMNMLGKDN